MLNLIRKYQYTLMLFVAVIVILAFSVWSGYTGGAAPGSASLMRVYGRDYPRDEYQRLLQSRELAEMLGQFQFVSILSSLDPRFGDPQGRNTIDYMVNLLVLREEAPKLGIKVTNEEVRNWVQSLPVLQTDGEFDPARAQQVVRNLGAYGMGQREINQLAVDVISLRRLTELVGGNISAAPNLIDSWYSIRNHTLKASVIQIPFETFEQQVEVSEEEIQRAFEENTGRFQRPEQRSLKYVHMAFPEETEEMSAEERRTQRNRFSTRIHELAVKALDEPENFADIMTEAGFEVRTTGLFAREEPPEGLEQEEQLLRAAFGLLFPEIIIGDPVRAAEGGYILFEVTDREAPKPRELEEVREEVRELVHQRKVREAAQEAATDLREHLRDRIEAGDEWSVLVAELEYDVLETGYFGQGEPPTDFPELLGTRLADSAPYLPLNEVSRPIVTEDGFALALVHYKELWQRPDAVQDRVWISDQLATGQSRTILNAWFQQAKDRARPVPSEFLFTTPTRPDDFN